MPANDRQLLQVLMKMGLLGVVALGRDPFNALCQRRFSKPEDFVIDPQHCRSCIITKPAGSPTGKLILNRALIRASVDAIDYVITHELCHMRHCHHGGAFFDLLDRVMPDWEKRKLRLECQLA